MDSSLALYRHACAGKGGNLFLSPYSIATAMAMLASGAAGETAREIERAMGSQWSRISEDTLISANAVWVRKDVNVRPEYVDLLHRRFDGTIDSLDFAHAADRINAWVAQVTRGKIPQLVSDGVIDDETLMILTNAIYMKAKWAQQFDASLSRPGTFHTEQGPVKTMMMGQTSRFAFLRDERVRVIELAYSHSRLSMLIALPEANDGLAALESELTPELLAGWDKRLKRQRVWLSMPRFTIESSYSFASALRAMGIELAFDTEGRSDFSGISSTHKLAISELIHKARIDVTEEGTEAAAATALVLRVGAALFQPKREEFHADHPFFFMIRRGKTIVFMGRVVNAESPVTWPLRPA